jgi:hypothetical protein
VFSFWERSAHILDSYTGPLFAKRKAGNPKNVASVGCFHICSLAEFFMSQSPYYIIVQTQTHKKETQFLLPLDSRDTSLLRARRTWANGYVYSLVHKRAEKTSKKLFRTETKTKGTKGLFSFSFFFFGNFVK